MISTWLYPIEALFSQSEISLIDALRDKRDRNHKDRHIFYVRDCHGDLYLNLADMRIYHLTMFQHGWQPVFLDFEAWLTKSGEVDFFMQGFHSMYTLLKDRRDRYQLAEFLAVADVIEMGVNPILKLVRYEQQIQADEIKSNEVSIDLRKRAIVLKTLIANHFNDQYSQVNIA